MKNLVSTIITLDVNEIDSYDFPIDKVFGLEVINKGIKFCFIIKFSSTNKNLICCGSGAHHRNCKTSSGELIKPPYLDRWSWYEYFDESFIVYADPIFFYDETITLGWYVGDKNQWYLETISEIIMKLSKKQKILQNNILFFGSSGGGFASICLGTLIKGSKVITNNPQFFVLNYHEFHIDNLLNTLYGEFPDLSKSEIIKKIDYRINVIELFKKYEYVPPIHYYVNLESTRDLYNQCIPFINKLKKLKFFADNLTIFFYIEKKQEPHSPLPTDITVDIIKSFSQNYLYNTEENNESKLTDNLNNENIFLNKQILELNDRITLLKDNIDQKNSENVVKRNLLNLKEQKLEQNEQKLFEKENLINKQQETLNLKDRYITERENLLTLKSKQLSEKEKQINDLLINLKLVEQAPFYKNIIFSEIGDSWNILVYDYATLNNHNDNSYILPRGNLERTKDGSVLSGNWGDLFFTPTNNEYYYDSPIVLELTVVDVKDSSNIRFQLYSTKQKLNRIFVFDELSVKKNNTVKIVYNGETTNFFIDDELKSTQKIAFSEKFRIGVQTFSNEAIFKYKNVKVYKYY